jgi:hypothetical protein
VAEVSKKRA